MGTENDCKKALNRTKNATDNAREVGELLKPLLEEIRDPETRSKKESEAKELSRKAVVAEREAKEAADKAISMAAATTNLVDTLQDRIMQFHILADHCKKITEEHIKNEKVRKLAEECMEEAEGLKHPLEGVKTVIESANKAAEEAREQAEVTNVTAIILKASINEVFQKYPKMKEEVEREIKETAQTTDDQTNTGSEGNRMPNENKEVDGSLPNKQNEEEIKNPNTNSAQAEAGSHTTAEQQ
ncbi:uncharacterized protein TM35_000821050, partial [Trypanosoma theileri]